MANFDEPLKVMEPEQFRLLRDLFEEACGLSLRPDLKFLAERRLAARLEALQLSDFSAYHRYLRFDPKGAEELEVAVELLLPHETYFFREPMQLQSFTDELCPQLEQQLKGSRRLRIWSAGCSTGEEPYTIAMLLDETRRFHTWEIEIHGTDLSRRVLGAARRAEYGPSALRGTSADRQMRHFDNLGNGRVRVKEALKHRVWFGQLNLVNTEAYAALPPLDVIFCRNVLIYFEPDVRRAVVRAFYERLKPGGWLLLGHSESLLTTSTEFEVVQLQGDLVYQRP